MPVYAAAAPSSLNKATLAMEIFDLDPEARSSKIISATKY
jgi:hypothetical protein